MIITYQLSVFFTLIISNPLENDLSEFSINNYVTLSLAFVSGLLLKIFDKFFLSGFILISYFTSYVFLPLMFIVLYCKGFFNCSGGLPISVFFRS